MNQSEEKLFSLTGFKLVDFENLRNTVNLNIIKIRLLGLYFSI